MILLVFIIATCAALLVGMVARAIATGYTRTGLK